MTSTHSRNLSLKTFSTFAVLWICLLLCVTAMPAPLQAQAPFLAEAQQPEKVRLLVKTAKGLSQGQAQAVLKGKGASVKKSIGLDLHIIEVSANAADNVIKGMKGDAQIVRVETDRPRKWQSAPSDTRYPDQWALPKISWDQVFGTVNPNYDTTVAILDTGVDATHPELSGVVVPGTSILEGGDPNVDENGHGTWVAGIVAARTDNQQGIAGVGYAHVQVMPVKVLDTNGIGWDGDIIQGIQYAVQNGAKVILMAFSAEGYSDSLQDAIDDAWAHNIVIVAAAGNNGDNTPTFPAGDRGVIGVSATDQNDALAPTSTFGPSVFLAAPGVDIPGPFPNNSYVVFSGTSGSAAIVAGAAALMRAIDPSLTNGMIVNRIAESADLAGTQVQTGNGRVNLQRAVADTSTNEIEPAGTTPFGNGGPFVGPYRITATNVNTTTSLNVVATPLGSSQGGVSFSGKVSPNPITDPAIPSGSPVNLEFQSGASCPNNGYSVSASATTDAAGNFSGTFTAPASFGAYSFRATFLASSVGQGSGATNWRSSSSLCQTITVGPTVTFTTAGFGGDVTASTTVLSVTVGVGSPVTVTKADLPKSFVVSSGTSVSFSYSSPISTTAPTKRYRWNSTAGTGSASGVTTQSGSITATANSNVTATYLAQYQLALAITSGVPSALSNISGGTNGTFYDTGTVLSFTATTPVSDGAGKQWTFKNWTGDVASPPNTGNPISITMDQARSVTANYVAQYQLTLAITAGVPNGLSNITGGTNNTFYDSGTVLNLSATNAVADGTGKQWAFKNWTGDVATPPNNSNPISVTMDQKRSITANYGVQFQLTLAITVGVPNGLSNISGGSNSTFYDTGTVLTLTATTPVADSPGKQWAFKNWTGDVTTPPNSSNPLSVTMNQARSITANYGLQFQLTLSITPGVPSALANISGGSSSTFYDTGTVLTLSATALVADGPGKQWVFKNWTGDVATPPNSINPVSVTMDQARTVAANYGAQYQLTLAITSGIPGGLAQITGGSNGTFYDAGTVLSLSGATPVADGPGKQWAFKNWTGDVVTPPNSSNPVSVTMSQARTITANYGVQYQLTLAITSGVPGGITHITGGSNSAFYDDGTVLNLTGGTPVADGAGKQWVFKNWTGDVMSSPNSSNPVSVTMSQARSVTANYGIQYQLTLAITAGVPGALSNISGGTNGAFYDDGTVLNLSGATPVADGAAKQWVFKNWTGDVATPPNSTNPVSVTMNQARTVTANYGAQYRLTLGITAGVPSGLANLSGGTNGTFYDDGAVLSLAAATPVADVVGKRWAFQNWTGDVVSSPNSSNPVSVTMDQARTISANYGVQYQLTLAITSGVPNGLTNISGGTSGSFYDVGTVLSLSGASPVVENASKQWAFRNWTGDVMSSPNTSNPVSVTMDQARSITANYEATYIIVASAGSNGAISPSGSVIVNSGANQGFTVTPNIHYHVLNVLVDGSSVGAVTSYTFTNVIAGHTISASFAIDQFTLTYTAGANGSISGPTPQTVDYGSNGTAVTAVANINYKFLTWSDGVLTAGRIETNVTANLSVSATFVEALGPISSNLLVNAVAMNTTGLITATVSDVLTGNSNIASAQFRVDGGSWTGMTAQDGSFSSPSESVKGTLPAFSAAGIHQVCVRGTDVWSNTGSEECILYAVYDPSAGFVTGGGWINSPVVPALPYMQVGGKANFGFVSKYKKGATVPDGQTEFQFQEGNLNFHSASYDWLVVSGTKAQFKGKGNIEGVTGDFNFLLSVTDGDLLAKNNPDYGKDKFRIKIMSRNADGTDGTTVYDNQNGQSDSNLDAGTYLGGGSIQIQVKQ
jgi:subtilisin family serine protease